MTQYNPLKLTRIAGRVVNRHIGVESDIALLCIPNTLKQSLHNNYLKDKFMCEEFLCPLEEDQMNTWFEQPFLTLSNDEWLTIQQWQYGVPYFAYEKNHIKYVYYTMDDSDKRFCYECAHLYCKEVAQYRIEKWSSCDFEYSQNLIDTIQCMKAWCHHCKTTSLFYIEEWCWNSDHLPARCSYKLQTIHV